MMLIYRCELDLALTYSMRRPALARECAATALRMAIAMRRPDLAACANELLGVL